MLRKRIIFTLIYADGFFNQSRNFRLQRVGNLRWLEKNYKFQEIAFSLDELIVLNASKGEKDIVKFAHTLSQLVDDVFIPIAAGGGIRSIQDAKLLFDSGADKIVLNSVLYQNQALVKELVSLYGSQSIIASVDYKRDGTLIKVLIDNGTKELDISFENYLLFLEDLGVGEIYLHSIEQDGTGFGYNLDIIKYIESSSVPIILSGGAGNSKHLSRGLEEEQISAVATANLFNFMGDGLPNAREEILNNGLNIARWRENETDS